MELIAALAHVRHVRKDLALLFQLQVLALRRGLPPLQLLHTMII
jgi:hypothetical protein